MSEERLPLADLLANAGDDDFLCGAAEVVMQSLIEAGVEGLISAGRHEQTAERAIHRNGHYDQTLNMRLGALELRGPKLPRGKLTRSAAQTEPFLESRKTSEKALVAVIQEA